MKDSSYVSPASIGIGFCEVVPAFVARCFAALRPGVAIVVGKGRVQKHFLLEPGGLALFGVQTFRRLSTQFEPMDAGPVDENYQLGPGDVVVGATVNAGGLLVVRATRVGSDTQLAQIARRRAAAA